jgi:hypothetical protein
MDDQSKLLITENQGKDSKIYPFVVKVEGFNETLLVLVGIALAHLSLMDHERVDGVCAGLAHELMKDLNLESKEYVEVFVNFLRNGMNVRDFEKSEWSGFYLKNILYCMSLVKAKLFNRLGKENLEFNEKNQESLQVFCRNFEISIFLQVEKKKMFFGDSKRFVVIHVQKENQEYQLLMNFELGFSSIREYYTEIFDIGSFFGELLKNPLKIVKRKKIPMLLRYFELNEYLLEKKTEELSEYLDALKQVNCFHKLIIMCKPLCGKFHCVECTFDHCKYSDPFNRRCECPNQISPENFCTLSKSIQKLRRSQRKKQIFTKTNIDDLSKIAKSFKPKPRSPKESQFESTHSPSSNPIPKNPSTEMRKCQECSNTQFPLKISCKSHDICMPCRKKDLEKCIRCKRGYNTQEKSILSLN